MQAFFAYLDWIWVSLCIGISVIQSECGKKAYNFIKKRLQSKFLPVNITKFSRAPILKNICKPLLLWFIRCTMQSSALDNFILYLYHKQFVFHFQKWKHCIYKLWIANFAIFTLICEHQLHKVKWENRSATKEENFNVKRKSWHNQI